MAQEVQIAPLQPQAPTGVAPILSNAGIPSQLSNRNIFTVLSWECKDKPPLDLELVLYPDWPQIGSAAAVFAGECSWQLRYGQAGGPTQQGQNHSWFNLGDNGVPWPIVQLPARGVRVRFAANWCAVDVSYRFNGNSTLPLKASLAPIGASGYPQPYPSNDAQQAIRVLGVDLPIPCRFPPGTVEWRVEATDPTMEIYTATPTGANLQTYLASDLAEFRPIHPGALFWQVETALYTAGQRAWAVYR